MSKYNKIPVIIPKEIDIDNMVQCYKGGVSVDNIAIDYSVSRDKVIKLLVTCGVYTSSLYDKIKDLRLHGKSDDEIMEIVGLSKKSFNRYVPYAKCIYGLDNATENAKKIRECRRKQLTN